MAIVTDIFSALMSIVSQMIPMFVSLFNGVITIFYDAGVDGDGLTVIGVLSLIGLAIGLFWLAFGFIRNLISFRS